MNRISSSWSPRRRRGIVGVLLAGALSLALAGDVLAAKWMVAAASHATGQAGTNWRTDLRIVNGGTTAAAATVYFLPADTDNSALSKKANVEIPAQGQLMLGDVIASQFAESGNGALLVDSPSNDLVVSSRTYNLVGSSTYGQFIAGVPAEQAIVAGETGHVVYLVKSSGYRTNFGFAGTTSTAGKVTITLFDGSNVKLGSGTFDVRPFGQSQVNDVFGSIGAAAAVVARAEVTTTTPIVAYASVIDNTTGDPFAIVAKHAADAFPEVLVPAASHASGFVGSLWRSDVRVWNTTGRDATLHVSFYPVGVSSPSAEHKTMSLGPKQVLALDDIILATFGKDAATGALRFTADQPLLVASRTYNQTTHGTFGQDIPGIGLPEALASGDVAIFSGLSDVGYRSNAGFFNGSIFPVELSLTLTSAAGTVLKTTTYSLPPFTMSQVNDVFRLMESSGTELASLQVTSSSPGFYTAYVSVIHNASNDPVYVPSKVTRSATSGACVALNPIAAGRKATYSLSQTSASGTVTGTMETTYLASSTTSTTTQTVTNLTGVGSTSSETTSTYKIVDVPSGFLSLSKLDVRASTQVGTITSTTTFNPSWLIGPATQWCSGMTWIVPTVQQTTTVLGQSVTTPTPAGNGQVLSIHSSLSVPAGSFDTVHHRMMVFSTDPTVPSTEVWIDKASSVMVRQVSYDAAGAVIGTVELTSLQ